MRHHTNTSRLKLRAAALALAATLTLTGALVDASSAFAGAWMRNSCWAGGTPEGWSGFQSGTVSQGSNNVATCTAAQDGSGALKAFLAMSQPVTVGTQEGLMYTPPSGSSLAGGRMLVGLDAYGYGTNATGVAAIYTPAFAYDGSNVLIQCARALAPCGPAYYPHGYSNWINLPSNRGGNLYLSASCGGTPGWTCNSGGSSVGPFAVWSMVNVYDSRLLLSSAATPSAGDFAGSLLTPGAHGTAALSFTASVSSGPGIYSATVSIDNKAVYSGTPNTNGGRCIPLGTDPTTGALMFGTQQPCPLSHRLDLTIATTGLRDGEHELKVTITDAAQNTQTVLRRTITTNNRTTPSSGLGSDAPSAANASLAGSPAAPEPLYANVLDAATRKLLGKAVRRSWRRSAVSLSGTLRSTAGLPAPAVPVVVLGQNAGVGEWRVLARSTSNAAGHWSLTAPRGPSRILAIAYGRNAAPTGTSVVKIRQVVTPALSLTVRAIGRGRLQFTGRLQIKPLGSPRPAVVIQARAPGRWQAVPGTPIRVDENGTYRFTYRMDRRGVGRRYSYRGVTLSTPLAAAANSPIRAGVAR